MSAGLEPLPESFAATRETLHRLAEQRVSPARLPESEISLRQTPGGFGTPWFWQDGALTRVRVEGAELVVERDGEVEREPIAEVDPVAAARLADWYAFSAQVLGRFLHEIGEEQDPSGLRLWPEHFDLALEAGAEKDGKRANYGASPGDGDHPEPYLYVSPWSAETEGEFWNAAAFNGAELGYAELLAAAAPGAAALELLRSGFRELTR